SFTIISALGDCSKAFSRRCITFITIVVVFASSLGPASTASAPLFMVPKLSFCSSVGSVSPASVSACSSFGFIFFKNIFYFLPLLQQLLLFTCKKLYIGFRYLTAAQNDKAFYHVAQLSYITGPVVLLKQLYCRIRKLLLCRTLLSRNLFGKVGHQHRYIVSPVV